MGDENPWGTPSKVYFSEKPIDLKAGNFQELDIKPTDFTCEVEPTRLDALADRVVQESVDNARFVADQSSHTITMEVEITPKQMREMRKLVRCPRLPRKLKKYVKKNYFDEYPKRCNAFLLRFAFAANNPAKAWKVGLSIGFDLAKNDEK